jgi:iron(III) transport system ATP-binding protein
MNQLEAGTPYLVIKDLTKKFGNFTALRDITFDIAESEFVCFLGPSGCGKTTLLRAIAGLDIHTSGSIFQAGKDISALPPSERDFGIVFQSYALFPNLTINKNVAYGLENARRPKSEIKARVDELLKLVGLPDQGVKYPAQLSGGQQQRVALARALATSPGLLLLDEPLSALDAKVRVHLRHEIKSLQERLGVTTVMVTHDQEEALAVADRIVVMNHGVIEQIGTPEEIYREPASLFVADFIGETNQFPGQAPAQGKIRVNAIELDCPVSALDGGKDAILVVRPEDIVLSEAGAAGTVPNSFPGKIEELEFLGDNWRIHLECPALAGYELTASVSINRARQFNFNEGMAISIQLVPERLRAFAAGVV